jgi:hypothetical protein
MERNQETLTTRDLAMGNEPATSSGSDPARDDREPLGGETTEVYDHESVEHDPATRGQGGTDSSVRDIRSQPEPALREGDRRETPVESALADTDAAPSPSTATPAGATSSSDADATASQAENVPAPASPAGSSETASANGAPLLSEELSTTFQRRWEEVQTRFVDEPRGAVEDADGLVANLMQQLAQGFAQERERLEAQWGRGEDISTEDLRVALQRYRSFFQRLLST